MKFELPENEIKDLFGAQILASLSQEAKERLIQDSIMHLCEPERGSYGASESPIQASFRRAVERVADRFATEYLESSPEFKEALLKVLPPLEKLAYDKVEVLQKSLIESLVNEITKY